MHPTIQMILTNLQQHRLSDGGFEERSDEGYRPDATAWAALALSAVEVDHDFIDSACLSLAQNQLADGRVPLARKHPEASWPTPLAILAWMNSRGYEQARERAVSFLLNFTGVHGEKPVDSPLAHNTALRGWPWIADTHSWIEPTALSVIALRAAGRGDHPRVVEAVAMLLDRQLPDGGWNYGNTKVYNQKLRPMPDSTGLALRALSGLVAEKEVMKSLDYLSGIIPGIASPFSLSWGLMGLRAWQQAPGTSEELIYRCLDRRSLYGDFSTTHLCLLLLAHPDMSESPIFQMQGGET